MAVGLGVSVAVGTIGDGGATNVEGSAAVNTGSSGEVCVGSELTGDGAP
jgi:hypothetical protein